MKTMMTTNDPKIEALVKYMQELFGLPGQIKSLTLTLDTSKPVEVSVTYLPIYKDDL